MKGHVYKRDVFKRHKTNEFSVGCLNCAAYINTIDYHYCIGRHYRKAKQRVFSPLNKNTRLGNVITQIQVRYIEYINITNTKF